MGATFTRLGIVQLGLTFRAPFLRVRKVRVSSGVGRFCTAAAVLAPGWVRVQQSHFNEALGKGLVSGFRVILG